MAQTFPTFLDIFNICFNHFKSYHRELQPKDENRNAKSDDPDKTAPLGPLWSGSALFVMICLSKT